MSLHCSFSNHCHFPSSCFPVNYLNIFSIWFKVPLVFVRSLLMHVIQWLLKSPYAPLTHCSHNLLAQTWPTPCGLWRPSQQLGLYVPRL